MDEIHSILKEYWGYSTFRPIQEEIIHSVLEGKDALALLPTGGGKSICFQVPALAKEGVCLVISPLIALMKDQVESLRKKNITAFAIYSGMTYKDVQQILKISSASNCKFLYVSPERLETKLFLEYLPALDINLIAVDEAHCISQWGYDFRPPYLRIESLRDELPGVPVLALTASATPKVQEDIITRLRFKTKNIFRQSFSRPDLSYSVFDTGTKIIKLVEILNKVQGSSIVYCKSRKRTRDIAEQLVSYNINADFYHAGLSTDERSRKQEAWIDNTIRTIVCTNAFGMGIDKPDVRVVIHIDPPDSLENYYQEAGRAGRDRKKAYAVLLYQEADLILLNEQPALRFPGIEQIRLVYQAIMNYLQIPSDMGEGNYYDFDLGDFTAKFKLDTTLVINSIKVLEQQGFLSFNEQVFLPSRVEFICNKNTLYEFERSAPELEPLIKSLLRTYEGIFDRSVNINEKSIAFLLRKDIEQVNKELRKLSQYSIIDYQAQKDSPQLFFLQNRIKAEDFRIDQRQYQERKKDYILRVKAFLDYITTKGCRSIATAAYFGEKDTKPCGVCDNCLALKRSKLTKEEFDSISTTILQAVSSNPIEPKQLLLLLKNSSKEKIWKVIAFLEGERRIRVSETGKVSKA
ncbi:MAG: RecQ family ATP-dependent DNA helicase [Chitinophagaceae bacterium]|nr:RecQ family ATP-dependent DNA helicase [Chitinophagaceae bacterium]